MKIRVKDLICLCLQYHGKTDSYRGGERCYFLTKVAKNFNINLAQVYLLFPKKTFGGRGESKGLLTVIGTA